MSQQLINHNEDLRLLCDAGYSITIQANHLLVHDVPYVDSQCEIKYGTLVSTLDMAGQKTHKPSTHIALFVGEQPCKKDGSPITTIMHSTNNQTLAPDLVINRSFSNKPKNGFANYYEKMVHYIRIISSYANSMNPTVRANKFKPIHTKVEETVFQYMDTASTRAGILNVTSKLEGHKIAIIGLGGTGSYVLDQVAKTPVAEIHLYDDDEFHTHNAFRAPGAATIEELNAAPKKVNRYHQSYSAMHRNIIPNDCRIEEDNISELAEMDFIFVCVDGGLIRKSLCDFLIQHEKPFVDCGMGVDLTNDCLGGILRVTASTPEKNDHAVKRIPFGDFANDEYSQNIQIEDLNAFNAILAVMKWKKYCEFYRDYDHEHNTTYTIDGNRLRDD